MFRRSRVSLKGRWIISIICFFCLLVPELILMAMATNSPFPKYEIGHSLIRLLWSVPLYYFMMLGHNWARWVTIVLFIAGSALGLAAVLDGIWFMTIPLAVSVAAIVVLIAVKEVRPKQRKW